MNAFYYLRHSTNTRRYWRSHGRLPNYVAPKLFSEKIQWRKLFDRNPLFPRFVDKIAVRSYVSELAPSLKCPRIVWTGNKPERIPWNELPDRFVVKPSHRSGGVIFVREPDELDRDRIILDGRHWLRAPYGRGPREWAYRYIDRAIVIEELLNTHKDPSRSMEYRLHVFDGRVEAIQVTSTRFENTRQSFSGKSYLFDREWRRLPYILVFSEEAGIDVPDRPQRLEDMLAAAEALGRGIDYIRVDLYLIDREIYFSEITIYPNSGYSVMTYDPALADDVTEPFDAFFGRKWSLPAVASAE